MELRRIDPDFVKELEKKVCHPAEWWGIKKVKKADKAKVEKVNKKEKPVDS